MLGVRGYYFLFVFLSLFFVFFAFFCLFFVFLSFFFFFFFFAFRTFGKKDFGFSECRFPHSSPPLGTSLELSVPRETQAPVC